MIASKIFNADGSNKRFLSDFIIQSEQFTRVYVYEFDNTLNPDGTEDQLQNGSVLQADWSFPDNVWKRGKDTPDSGDDLVTIDKWDLVTNSILMYDAPLAPSKIWIEVATTPEEFGTTLTQPSVERAEQAAADALAQATQAAADAAIAAAEAASAAADAAAGGTDAVAAAASAAAALVSQTAAAAAQAAAEVAQAAAEAAQVAAAASAAAAAISAGNSNTSALASAASAGAAAASESASAASAAAASASQSAAAASASAASASEIAAAASAAAAALSEANISTAISDQIGVTVQGYDANTVVEDRSLIAEDNLIDFTKKNFELTATAANITATGLTGTFPREGTIIVHSAENVTGWGVEFKFKTVPTDLTGDETFGYFIEDATNIWIGRVQ